MLHNEDLAHIGHYRIKPPCRRSGQTCTMLHCEWQGMLIDRLRGGFKAGLAGTERRVNDSYTADWHLQTPSAGWIRDKQKAQIA